MTRSSDERLFRAVREVGILLCPGFSRLALPSVTEPLFIANWLTGGARFHWRVLSTDGLAVPSSSGGAVAVDAPLRPDDAFDIVFVLASFDAQASAGDGRVMTWLRRLYRQGAEIAGIEIGVEVVAAAGLCDGRRVAVHWYNAEAFRERFPNVTGEAIRTARDGRILSAAGPSATLDLMLGLIGQEAGGEIARDVARHLLHEERDAAAGAVAGSGAPADPVIARAQAMMADRLDAAPDCAALAQDLGLSLRQLQRRFMVSEARSVSQVWRELRMARAHQLVQQTAVSLTEIAVTTGYGSLEAFSRAYRRRFGTPPSRDRAQSTKSTVFRPSA